MTKYITTDRLLYTFSWPTATTTNNGSPSTYSKLTATNNVMFDLYTPTLGYVVTGVALNALPAGYGLYQYTTYGFSILVPASAILSSGRYTMIVYANPALPAANTYEVQIQYAEIDDSYQLIYNQTLAANTSVQAGGYVASRVNNMNTQIVTGGAGTVKDNAATAATAATASAASAATAATQSTIAASRATTINNKLGTPTPPRTLSQTIELAYAVTNNAKRFDAATGWLYLRNEANTADLGYWPCFQDFAGLVPATSYNNIVYQGRFQTLP